MRIRLLGSFELLDETDRLVEVATRKRREVLALLALEANRVVPTETLLTSVWGDEPPRAARSALQGHIAQLRKQLGGGMRLVTRPPGYVLEAPAGRIDAHRFLDLLRRASGDAADPDTAEDLLHDALALWRGPALTGLGGDRLTDWSVDLHQHRLTALEALGQRLVARGRCAELLADLGEAAREHPFRESLVALLMLALHQDGRQADAMAVYHRTRAGLADELGVDPGPALRTAYETLLHGETRAAQPQGVEVVPGFPTAGRVVPAQLPAEPRGFVGRATELAMLDRLAGGTASSDGPASAGGLVVIGGPAGVGKTALVARWAHRVAERFPDGRLFVDLRGFDRAEPVEPGDALAGFLRALGVGGADLPAGLDERAALYRSLTAGRRLLVVLDNVDTVERVRPLLPAGAGCATVVTGRRRLDSLVVGEGAVPVGLGPLTSGESLGLVAALAGKERLARERDAGRRLVELCDRLPLALRLAAARLAVRPAGTVAELVTRLSDERQRLDTLRTDDDATGMAAALSLTCRGLPPHPALLLRRLGVHPRGPVDLAAAGVMTGLADAEIRAALAVLESRYLVAEAPGDRWLPPDLVRLYGRQLAAEHDDNQHRPVRAVPGNGTGRRRSPVVRAVRAGMPVVGGN